VGNVSYTIEKNNISATFDNWINYKGEITDTQNLLLNLKEKTDDSKIKNDIDNLYKINEKYSNLYLIYISEVLENEELKNHKERMDELEKEKEELEEQLSKNLYQFKESLDLKEIKFSDISKFLKPNELYIDYAKAYKNYYIFTLDSKNNVTFEKIDKNKTKEIKNLIAVRGQEAKNLSSKIYQLLLENPIGKDNLAKFDKLIISRDGLLNQLAFEILYNEKTGKYLIEEKEIKYIPSAKEFLRLQNRQKRENSDKIVVFSNPDFEIDIKSKVRGEETRGSMELPQFGEINGTKKEADSIKNIFGKMVINYEKENATEDNLFKTKSPKILHFATHGFYTSDENLSFSNLKSGIALSGYNISVRDGESSQGIVTASKLLKLDLTGTELVVFSACQTGLGDINGAEGVEGLNKVVIQAGANRVMSSLWNISDEKTVLFMKYFYGFLKEKQGYSEALRNAKLKMINDGLKPYYWGAFILNGID